MWLVAALGAIGTGVIFITAGIWARARPDSFRRTFPSRRSEAYDLRTMRYLVPLPVVCSVIAIAMGFISLLSG